jgi:L-alanine-DL-glutamate epimerase-like enolase superfamily enzyme
MVQGAGLQEQTGRRGHSDGTGAAVAPVRIEAFKLTTLAFPLTPPFRAAVRLIDTVDILLVELHAGDGLLGCGYAFAFGAGDLAPVLASAQSLCASLVGEDATKTERLWARMNRLLALVGASGPTLSALAAIDIALWDVAGHACGRSVSDMLGGARDSIPVYGSNGSLQLSVDELVAEALGFVRLGYPAYKFKVGSSLAQDVERVRAVREAVGASIQLMADGTQQWSPKEAIRVAHALAPYDLRWLEEPVNAQDIEGCAEVRRASPMDIATGETNFGVTESARLLQLHATDILMPNLQRVGGITGWRKVAAMAELHRISMASHVYGEIGVHLMCGVPNALTLEVVPWWPKLFNESLAIRDGMASPPAAPGLGLTLNHALVEAHRVH